MSCDQPYTVHILGRDYRFKNPSEKSSQLTAMALALDQRLAAQATELPLATRDQLLILTAINLLGELAEQQQQSQSQLLQLLTQLTEAG